MTDINAINNYLNELLDQDKMPDYGINGIQVECDGEINKAAFAVDASLESISEAVEQNCNLLVVHHGLFWGREQAVKGAHRKHLKLLLENNIGLIAYHLPLDRHPEYGNNALILQELGVRELAPFGFYKGKNIGFSGELVMPVNIDGIVSHLRWDRDIVRSLNFGPELVQKVAIVSGGGGSHFSEAIEAGIDLYITGDAQHVVYHPAREHSISVLFGGHYQTETYGVRALENLLKEQFSLETVFLDIPTGL